MHVSYPKFGREDDFGATHGAIQLTLIFLAPASLAAQRVRPMTACYPARQRGKFHRLLTKQGATGLPY